MRSSAATVDPASSAGCSGIAKPMLADYGCLRLMVTEELLVLASHLSRAAELEG